VKPARPRPDALDQAKRPKDEVDPTEADGDAVLTAEERARLLAELEAEFDDQSAGISA
jgi:hypothetical protein